MINRSSEYEGSQISPENIERLRCAYEKYKPFISGYFRRRFSNSDEVDDWTSDVFLCACKGIANFEGGEDEIKRWLSKIASNIAIDAYRRKKRRMKNPICSIDDFYSLADTSLSPVQEVINNETARELHEAVQSLDRIGHEVITQRFFGELDTNTIAANIGLSVGNVRVVQHRVVKHLSSMLQD